MNFIDLLVTSAALSMDAFAASVSKGLSAGEKLSWKHCLLAGAWFGGFQALMPLLGYMLAGTVLRPLLRANHWVAFCLLLLIGANMIVEAVTPGKGKNSDSFGPGPMLLLALATSIDALAAGISFSLTGANIWVAITLAGTITFAVSAGGARIGRLFGAKYKKSAEITGGVILILMGIKILAEHLWGG